MVVTSVSDAYGGLSATTEFGKGAVVTITGEGTVRAIGPDVEDRLLRIDRVGRESIKSRGRDRTAGGGAAFVDVPELESKW